MELGSGGVGRLKDSEYGWNESHPNKPISRLAQKMAE
jgi:hypothetical protein